jgi:hypothetical protein
MRRISGWPLAIGLVSCLALAPRPGTAQNLAFNGEFDVDVAGWFAGGGVASWNPDDHELCPESGSASIFNDLPGAGTVYFQRCVAGVVGGEPYSIGVDLRLPGADATEASARAELRFYADVNCAGSALELLFTPLVESDPAAPWVRSELLATTASASATALHIAVAIQKNVAGEYTAGVDGIFLVHGAGLLLRDGFESGSTCRWSATAG